MAQSTKVLLIEDDTVDSELVHRSLTQQSDHHYDILHVDSLEKATEIDHDDFDVILLDLTLPDSTGLDTVTRMLEAFPDTPIIVLTGSDDPNVGTSVVQLGAQDFCTKGEVNTFPLIKTIQYAMLRKKAQRLESQLLEAQKLESLGALASGIAHDFNNMLLSVLGHADLALLKLDSDATAVSNLNSIKIAGVRMAELTKQMLDYAGKGRFSSENVDLSSLVQKIGELLQVSVSKDINILYDLDPDLPALKVDPRQVRQAVLNLVTNAAEAIAENEGVIRLSTGTITLDKPHPNNLVNTDSIAAGDYVYLEVTDNGCGLLIHDKRKIFEPFYSTKPSGRGLGLATTLGIVNRHGGAIQIESQRSEGTKIRILFPRNAAAAAKEVETPGTEDWTGFGTALVVDDEASVSDVTQQYLKLLGFKVLVAKDGVEAVELLTQHRVSIDIVVLDMNMPRMDGNETLQRMREIVPQLKVIVATGFDVQLFSNKLSVEGQTVLLQKPFDLNTLRTTLKDMIEEPLDVNARVMRLLA